MIVDVPTKVVGSFGSEILPVLTHKSGLKYRDKIVDLFTIRECLNHYKDVEVKDRIVLDAGANLGGFSFLAASKGAKSVYSFEPEPDTYALLVENLEHFDNCYTHNRALTSNSGETVSFYVGSGNGAPSLASVDKRRGRKQLVVKNEDFVALLNRIPFEVIKMDTEGGEFDLLPHIPDSCVEAAIEFHGDDKTRLEQLPDLYSDFMKKGWKIVREKRKDFYVKSTLAKGKVPYYCIDGLYRR